MMCEILFVPLCEDTIPFSARLTGMCYTIITSTEL